MDNDNRPAYVTRDTILKLLSDDEVGRVSMAETAAHLAAGVEYLDLENLDQGVQRAGSQMTPMGHVLPKSAVHAETWTRILTHIDMPRV